VEWLNARATLLILDNGEHLLDAIAALVSEIVAGSASTTVVVTSREPLGVAGEVVRPVPSLPVSRVSTSRAKRPKSRSRSTGSRSPWNLPASLQSRG
jgi:predicted ATPase